MARTVCPWWIGYLLLGPLAPDAPTPRADPGALCPLRDDRSGARTGDGILHSRPRPSCRTVGPGRGGGRPVAHARRSRPPRCESGPCRSRSDTTGRSVQLGCGRPDRPGGFGACLRGRPRIPGRPELLRRGGGKPSAGRRLLFAEPSGHVSASAFEDELRAAASAGLSVQGRPTIRSSRAALLVKARD